MSRIRRWCYTLFNYTGDDLQWLQTMKCNYHVYGLEVCPETSRPHVQGYVEFKDAVTMRALKKRIRRNDVHLTPANGDSLQNRNYCLGIDQEKKTPNEITFEAGERTKTDKEKGQMEIDRWEQALTAAKEGRFDDIPAEIQLRYVGNIQRIHSMYRSDPTDLDHETGVWIYGPPRVGKSRTVRTICKELDVRLYDKLLNKWHDNYSDHEVMLLDDFDHNHTMLSSYIKRWSDCYAYRAEYKGGTMVVRPMAVVVTSNYHPRDLFVDDVTLCDAICARFKIIHMTAKNDMGSVRSATRAIESLISAQEV